MFETFHCSFVWYDFCLKSAYLGSWTQRSRGYPDPPTLLCPALFCVNTGLGLQITYIVNTYLCCATCIDFGQHTTVCLCKTHPSIWVRIVAIIIWHLPYWKSHQTQWHTATSNHSKVQSLVNISKHWSGI